MSSLKQHVTFYCLLVVFYILFSPGFVDSTREARGIAYLTASQSLALKAFRFNSPSQSITRLANLMSTLVKD